MSRQSRPARNSQCPLGSMVCLLGVALLLLGGSEDASGRDTAPSDRAGFVQRFFGFQRPNRLEKASSLPSVEPQRFPKESTGSNPFSSLLQQLKATNNTEVAIRSQAPSPNSPSPDVVQPAVAISLAEVPAFGTETKPPNGDLSSLWWSMTKATNSPPEVRSAAKHPDRTATLPSKKKAPETEEVTSLLWPFYVTNDNSTKHDRSYGRQETTPGLLANGVQNTPRWHDGLFHQWTLTSNPRADANILAPVLRPEAIAWSTGWNDQIVSLAQSLWMTNEGSLPTRDDAGRLFTRNAPRTARRCP